MSILSIFSIMSILSIWFLKKGKKLLHSLRTCRRVPVSVSVFRLFVQIFTEPFFVTEILAYRRKTERETKAITTAIEVLFLKTATSLRNIWLLKSCFKGINITAYTIGHLSFTHPFLIHKIPFGFAWFFSWIDFGHLSLLILKPCTLSSKRWRSLYLCLSGHTLKHFATFHGVV